MTIPEMYHWILDNAAQVVFWIGAVFLFGYTIYNGIMEINGK